MTDVDDRIAHQWRDLSTRSGTPNPCMEPEFIYPAARHLPEVSGLELLLVEEGETLVALLPLYPSSRRGSVPIVPGLRSSWDQVLLGEPLIAPGYEAAAAHSVLTFLSHNRHAFWLRLQTLDADGLFAQSLVDGLRLAHSSAQIDTWTRGLAIRRSQPTYLAGRHANLKRLLRQRRAFERSTGKPLSVIDRSSDPHAVDEFMAMEAAGWKGRGGVAFLNRPGHADFLRDTCQGFRERGRLRLWSLQSGDKSLAMKLNLAAGDSLFCYLIAFDEAYAPVSPGLQLEIENFDLFHAEPVFRVMDSCASSNNAFANRLYPDRRALMDLNIGSGLVGRALISLVPAGRWASGVARSVRLRRGGGAERVG